MSNAEADFILTNQTKVSNRFENPDCFVSFCSVLRCNVQDYIWNKGTRCDWAVTEFQVMCVVVGVASLVLILLFMIIVFFAKRLHHLKNENRRLRRHRCVCVCV